MKHVLRRHASRLARVSRHASRWTLYAVASVFVLLLAVYLAARALLPGIENKKAELEDYLTRKTAHTVRIEKLEAYWEGVFPGFHIQGLNVYAPDSQRPSVRLAELHASLAPLALLWGEIDIHNLVLTRPSATLERLADGRMRISGFEPAVLDAGEGAGEEFVNWLLKQRRLTIHDGELRWIDHRDGGERLQLAGVQFDLRNSGERHRAALSAKLPDALCRECALTLDITGNPLTGDDWSGTIQVRAAGLDVERLPRIARERLPAKLRGKFDLQLSTRWDEATPVYARGEAGVVGLRLPLAGIDNPVVIGHAGGEVTWKAKDEGWQLDFERLTLGLSGRPWSAERLRLARRANGHALQVQHVELADVSDFVAGLDASHPFVREWAAIRPGGALDNLAIELVGDWRAPTGFNASADVRRLSTNAHAALPGVRGLSGRVAFSQDGGEAVVDTDGIVLDMPRVFRGPLDARRVSGRLMWERRNDHWRVDGNDLRVTSPDGTGAGQLSMRVPFDRAVSPYLKLRVDFRDGNGAQAARYFPAPHLPPRILAWADSAFLGGTVTRGHVIYDGPVRAFPFEHGEGHFEIRGHVRDGVYRYLPGWISITRADVDVAIVGPEILVTGHGKIGSLDATQVVVRTRATPGDTPSVVTVSGKVRGPVAETLRVLSEVEAPSAKWGPYVPRGMKAEGNGSLNLDLKITPRERLLQVAGEYRVNGASLRFPAGVSVNAVTGAVRFTETGVLDGRLSGRALGGDALVSAARADDGRVVVDARGRVAAAALARLHSAALADRVSGAAEWSLAWRQGAGLGDVRFEAALEEIKTVLPAPFDRPDGLLADKLVVRTEQSRPDWQVWDVRAADVVRGKLAFARADGVWRFMRGHVGFGLARVALPTSDGLQLSARLSALDLDEWLPFSRPGSESPRLFKHISAEVKQLDMFDRRWGRLYLDLTAADDGWRALIDGDAAAGKGVFTPPRPAARRPAAIRLDLSYLRLPEKKHRGQDTAIDPATLPAIDVRAHSLEYRGRVLGDADFSAAPIDHGWRVARFNLISPDMTLTSNGTWRLNGQRHASEFSMQLTATDMGKALEAFGAPGQLAGGKVEMRTSLAWPGSPTNPRLTGLDGRVEIAAEKGRFLQFDPGAARLFGLLDLSSIARYLTLDFTSAFGKGFTFDKIHGTIRIDDGNAYTNDLAVKSPSAGLTVEGRVGLANEDFDLMLGITPQLRDTLTFTSWGLFGPQAAAIVLAFQKIFKKQIAKGTQIKYVVTGPWKNPNVSKVVKPPADAPSPG